MKKLKNLSIITIVMILLLSISLFAIDPAQANDAVRLETIDQIYISALKNDVKQIQQIIPIEHITTEGQHQFNNNNYGYFIESKFHLNLYYICHYVIYTFENIYDEQTFIYSAKMTVVDNGYFNLF